MIIDVHRHLIIKGTVQGHYIRGAQKSFTMMYNKVHQTNYTPAQFTEQVVRPWIDPTADNIIEEMDAAGVDKTVIFTVDYGLLFGEAPINAFDQNKLYSEIARRHEGRLIPFMAIDPRRKGAVEHCERAYNEWGMKGFKLHAGVGYMPEDPCCYWVYEKAAQWNIPVMCHTGGAPTSLPALRWENSRPAYFASAAARYPEVDFIFAHCGDFAWWQEAIQAAAWLPNVYVDLSLWQKPYKKWPKNRFYQWLRDIIDIAGAEKILFATDALYPNLMCPLKEWVQAFKTRETDIRFTDEEIDMILGGSAMKVLGLAQ
ncbi:MAG: amidohydrolase family protein [Syntrophobacteraceae bacterium]